MKNCEAGGLCGIPSIGRSTVSTPCFQKSVNSLNHQLKVAECLKEIISDARVWRDFGAFSRYMISLSPFSPLSALACAAMMFATSASMAAVEWPPTGKPIPAGFGVQLKGNNESPENLDLIQDLGLTWVRRGFIWEAVEKEQGVYDFSKYDQFIAECKKRGLKIIGCIAFSNRLYGTHAKDEPGRTGYAKFSAALAERYKDEDIIWEIWNEPNVMTFWGKHGKKGNTPEYAAEYYGLVKATVPEMKKANPKCIVLGGSVSNMWSESYNWMDAIFAMGVLKTGIDGWSVHPYGLKSPEDYIEAYDIMRKSMAKNGGPADIPVVNSERGFPLGKAEGYAGGDEALAAEYQSWHLVRQYIIDLYCNVNVTIWYEWMGSDSEGFSLYKPDKQLPVNTACRVLIEQLKGYSLNKRIAIGNTRDFAMSFTTPSGAEKVVVWTSPPPMQTVDKTTPHVAKIPVNAMGEIEVIDIYGKLGRAEARGGVVEIMISGAPQYLVIKK